VLQKKIKLSLCINIIKYLVCQLRIRLPYHIPNLDSNDEIFTKDEDFKTEANKLIETVISYILEDITLLDSKINKNNLEEVEFLSKLCIDSAELFSQNFEQSKYSNSVCRKMIELAKKYLDPFKNKKAELANSETLKALIALCNKFDIS